MRDFFYQVFHGICYVFGFLVLAFANKVVRDTLPDVSLKSLKRYFMQFMNYLSFVGCILIVMLLIRFVSGSKDPKLQAQFVGLSIILVLLIGLHTNKLKLPELLKTKPLN